MSYKYNKMPKVPEILKAVRRSITRDIRRNGFSFEEFANEIGLSAGTLENKLKPACMVNDLSVTELVQIMDTTGDYEPLETITKRYGLVLCRPEDVQKNGDPIAVVTIGALELGAILGELERSVKEAVEDSVLDEQEQETIGDLLYALRKAANGIESYLKRRRKDD